MPEPVTAPPTRKPVAYPPSFCPDTVDNGRMWGGCGPDSPCADSNKCCSKWGWCGMGAVYCDPELCCQNNCWGGEGDNNDDGSVLTPDPVINASVSTPAPAYAPVPVMIPAPVTIPPTAPVVSPPSSCPNTYNSDQLGGCGQESPCVDSGKCCSQWGWCGESSDYCKRDNCCQSNCW